MLPFITRWELSQEFQSCTVQWENMKRRITITLATCYSWPNFQVLHPGMGREPSNFLTLFFYYSIYTHLPYIRTDALCKGTVFSNFSLNLFLPERAIKDTSIYSLEEQQQLNFLSFLFLHTGNVPPFIMWNGMSHDFSQCTSSIYIPGNPGFNNAKALEKCIFAAGVCLP